MRARFALPLAIAAVALIFAPAAWADELITNGDFEDGNFNGWTVVTGAAGSYATGWYIDAPGTTTPVSGHSTVGGSSYGSYYAVSDQQGVSTQILYQAFTVTAGSSVTLDFDMFRNDYDSGPLGTSLDYNGLNQNTRVDILSSVTDPYSTGSAVLSNLAIGVDSGADPHAFQHYSFDISSIVGGGGTFYVRFASVERQFFLNMGIDNVSIQQTVPEPATLALFGLGAAGIAAAKRRRRNRAAAV